MWLSGQAASRVRYVSTTASFQESPAASPRRNTGAPASNVVWKSVAYSRAIASRSAASAIASRSVTVGVPATSWCGERPSPPGRAWRIAAYTSCASATVVSPSVVATAVRSVAAPSEEIRAARASGASSRTRPRFVLDGTQRPVASTAARMVAPSDMAPAMTIVPPNIERTLRINARWLIVPE